MNISKSLLSEFDQEMAKTRKSLERIPEDKLDWKPHTKSWSMIALATHLANLPTWTMHIIKQDSMDLRPSPDTPPPKTIPATSRQEVLDRFDKNIADARAAISDASDDHMLSSWTLLSGGKVIFELKRVAVLRSFVMNHNVHHRAQLGVYLRLNDVAVPAIYGPSADESGL